MESAYSLIKRQSNKWLTPEDEEDFSSPPKDGWRATFTNRNILLGLAAVAVILLFIITGAGITRSRSSFPSISGFDILQSATAQSAVHFQLPDSPKVCVLARTYGSQLSYLPIFLLTLWHGGFPNIQVFILNTDTSMKSSDMQQALDLVNIMTGKSDYASFLDFSPGLTSGDYGYALTDEALRYFYQPENAHLGCEYLMITNGDNVYTQGFAKFVQPGMDKGADLIGFDFVSHHTWSDYKTTFDGKAYVDSSGSLIYKQVEFRTSQIDLGAAMFKFSLLKEHNLTFIGTGEYGWFSDGHFIEVVNDLASITFLQHSILLLHQ